MLRRLAVAPLVASALVACSANDDAPPPASAEDAGEEAGPPLAPFVDSADVLVPGVGVDARDCRSQVCRHNENTDLYRWDGAIYFVHRTAMSQRLGPNSALHVYRSDDEGKTFRDLATLPAPDDRDLRDPHFFVVGDELRIKALTRLPVDSVRDSDVETIPVVYRSKDGASWSAPVQAAPATWSFWRPKQRGTTWYSAAYEDGDRSVVLFSSEDGLAWTKGAVVYGVAEDTPLETELVFLPSGKLLALVRTDGNDYEYLGDKGPDHLRTKVCWADAPYAHFDCPAELPGERLDGPLAFFWRSRLFVVARKHLPVAVRKRTALYEITGTLEGGPIAIREHGELPSAGDTSYAGAVELADGRVLLTWYSGELAKDEGWGLAMFDETDIWRAVIDPARLEP